MNLSLDFAFEGFRVIREKPRLILFWGMLMVLGNGIGSCLFIAMAGPTWESFSRLTNSADPTLTIKLMQQMLPAVGVIAPISLVTQAIATCAIYRASFNMKNDSFGYLHFGPDEVRQLVVAILFWVLSAGLAFTFVFLGCLTVGVFEAAAKGASIPGIVAACVVLGILYVWIVARLSLCSVQSFNEKRINLFGSWALTKGQGWALIGGYVVMFIMMTFVFALCFGIFWALAMVSNGGDWGTMSPILHPDMTSLQAYLKPVMIVFIIVSDGIIGPLLAAIQIGAQAAAYRSLGGKTPRLLAEGVF